MPDEQLPSIRQAYLPEQDSYGRFRRALRQSDQIVLDDLFASIEKHKAAAAIATNTLPVENILLSMLLEERKEIARLRFQLEALLKSLVDPGSCQTQIGDQSC